ncbi:MAG: Ig-like domain-containing protein, partial [Gammaproteobacteria bacterium]|nr:Ig-like domain-containing protein [Gammaproteobacteria bacterium]
MGKVIVNPWVRIIPLVAVLLVGIAAIIGSGGGSDPGVDLPWAVDKTFSLKQDDVLEINAATLLDSSNSYVVNDLGVEPSTVTATAASWGNAVVVDTLITYTPNAGFIGVDTIDYTIEDANNNAESGTITIVVTELMPSPRQIALDSANNRALVTDDSLRAVVSVDLTTGLQTYFSTPVTPDAGNPFSAPNGIAVDTVNNRALVTDVFLDAVIAVDLVTGARTVFSDATTPDASNPFTSPDAVVIDAAHNRALITDSGLGAVVAVDLDSGARTILSAATTPDTENPFTAPTGIALDAANNRALVTDRVLAAVIAVDLTTGSRTILSAATTPNSRNVFAAPSGIVIDAANDRALVADLAQAVVMAVDLTTGERKVVSSYYFPDNRNTFQRPGAMVLDEAGDRALVVDAILARIVSVNLDATLDNRLGKRTFLPESAVLLTDNQLQSVHAIVIDAAHNRALVTDSAIDAVIAVDAVTGARTIFSDATTPSDDNPLAGPLGLAIDSGNG